MQLTLQKYHNYNYDVCDKCHKDIDANKAWTFFNRNNKATFSLCGKCASLRTIEVTPSWSFVAYVNQDCDICRRIIKAGEYVNVFSVQDRLPVFVCDDCV